MNVFKQSENKWRKNMNVSKVNNISFRGLLTISGPDKIKEIIVNTNSVSTIKSLVYLDKKEDSDNVLGVGAKDYAVITMNTGIRVTTFVPIDKVIDAYKQAEANGEAKLESKRNPVMEKPLLVAESNLL